MENENLVDHNLIGVESIGGRVKTAKEYWNDQFLKEPFPDGKAPSAFLQAMLPRLQKGKVLDIAMGSGKNAVFLAQHGCTVKGFDISSEAIKLAHTLAGECGVAIETQNVDLDFFLMGLMEYDSIVMTRFKPALTRFYPEMIRALKQGGTLLIESLGVGAMTQALAKEDSFKDIYFSTNELLRHLKDLQILFYQEGEVDGVHVVQCLAKKPIDRDAVKYDLFDMHTGSGNRDEKSKHLELAEQLFRR
jgi:SAM-dependent methyltransferase